jgi:thiol:disulfide interchange protein DsbD
VLLPFCLLPFLPLSATEPVVEARDTEAFSSGRLAGLRREGKPVFVDMTAAWCITCLVNERLVLDSPSIRKAFSENDVTFLRGDWTSRNLDITAFLHEHGREGVPLYIYYPPQGEARLLPQILTSDLVIGTIKRR